MLAIQLERLSLNFDKLVLSLESSSFLSPLDFTNRKL